MNTTETHEKNSVLIVDDQPNNIHTLGRLIRDDYKVMATTSGSRALEIAESDNPPGIGSVQGVCGTAWWQNLVAK